ncbi:MAG TPA: pilus assembly protein PilM [Thermoanaerobacterales bacterium]|jgi:type IV pilus assembly protein PilM|nr:pilus assembly protein PilM [Thermoanaerobacterales bacterium]
MLFRASYLGIDLGAEKINAAQLVNKGNNKIIKSLYQMENPIGDTVFSKPKEKAAIRQCLAKINKKFPSNNVVIGISSKLAMFRHVTLPLLNKKELKEAIFWEMQEFSTVLNSDYISDYELLEKQKDTYRVLLVAVPKDIILDYIEVAGDAGFFLKALDVYPLANARVLRAQKKTDVTAIIDLSSCNREVTIVDDGKIVFNRNLNISYNSTTSKEIFNMISTNTNLTDHTASGLGFLSPPYKNLILEISRTFNFYTLQSKSRQIDEIVLIGQGSELQHCKDVLKRIFNTKVYTGKEFKYDFISKNLVIDGNHLDFFSAIGFALRG